MIPEPTSSCLWLLFVHAGMLQLLLRFSMREGQENTVGAGVCSVDKINHV